MIKVPRKIVIVGDKMAGLALRGTAQSQLRILEKDMKFRGLKQGSKTVSTSEYVIEVWSSFNLQGVKITTFGGGKLEQEVEEVCFCANCIARGRVVKVNGLYGEVDITFDVEVCSGKTYVMFKNTVPTDFAEFEVGAEVIVIINPVLAPAEFDICTLCGITKTACSAPAYMVTPVWTKHPRWINA